MNAGNYPVSLAGRGTAQPAAAALLLAATLYKEAGRPATGTPPPDFSNAPG